MGNPINNDTTIAIYTKRISAMKKYVAGGKYQISIGGKVLEPAEALQAFEDCLGGRTAVIVAHAAYKSALVVRDQCDTRFRTTDEAMKGWVLNTFGVDSVEAKEFGYAPRKMPTMAVADKANAVLLNQATRKARGTMGKRERERIKGTLDGDAVPEDTAGHSATAPIVVRGAAQLAAPVVAPVVSALRRGGDS